ncbi:lytic murein transglycosylase [Marinobacter sp. C2H3]|uniref:lytic murein transglycosylase n=1 Tax=Marinobacter sp. C2H3 TaxID=3119003 RepID=UPI00300E941C
MFTPSARTLQRSLALAAALIGAGTVHAAGAADAATPEATPTEDFGACKQRLEQRAVAEGVRPQTAQAVMANAEYLQRVIDLDRRQPEFTTTFADYLNRRVNDDRVTEGRELLREHADLLERITRETGVPGPYLVAFWGLETNFGKYFGKMSVPSALTTLACDPRRSEFFSRQLMAALEIIDEGDIPADQMEGSWAGAMGHVQFMPTVFLAHAVDADGDGKRDLWHSLPDALMSAGHFLQSMGWDGDYRWGREVRLPEGFDYSLADGRRLPLSEWRKKGITDAFGNALADEPVKAKLLVPAGHRGPAFLVYHNFRVIMGWNQSEYYAVAVGYLADRIAGAGKLQQPPPEDVPSLSRSRVIQLQTALNDAGFDAGEPDGILGPATRAAIRQYQQAKGLVPDGYPGQQLLASLRVIDQP